MKNVILTKPKAKQPTEVHVFQPYCFRLPKTGERDPFFGLSRSAWNALILLSACRTKEKSQGVALSKKPPVESFTKKLPHEKRSARFIVFRSALDYFEKFAQEQNGGAGQ